MGKIQAIETGLSILWKMPKSKINPKTLGYVCPNGNINFQSEEIAFNYAKNCVMKALKSENPYERGLLIKDRTIVADVHGVKNQVRFPDDIDLTGLIMVHGHPENTPISLGDAQLLVSNGMKKIVAYNNNGEFSSLSLIPFKTSKIFGFLPDRFKNWIQKINAKGNFVQLQIAIDKMRKTINTEVGLDDLIKEIRILYQNSDNLQRKMIADWCKCISQNISGNTSEFPSTIKPIFDKANELLLQTVPKQSGYTHNLLTKNAKDFDMVYETNYSDDIIKSWDI